MNLFIHKFNKLICSDSIFWKHYYRPLQQNDATARLILTSRSNAMISKQMTAKILPMILFLASFLHAAGSLSDGYILFGTFDGKATILMDKNGNATHTWTHESKNGYAVYLLDNGNLLRTAQVDANVRYPSAAMPVQGIIEEVDMESNILWTYQLANDTFITHHDMKPLPNGNILACAFELFTKEELAKCNIDTTLLSGGGGGFGGMSSKTLLLFTAGLM